MESTKIIFIMFFSFVFLSSSYIFAIHEEDLQETVDDNFIGDEAPTHDEDDFLGSQAPLPPDEVLEERMPQMTGEMASDIEGETLQSDFLESSKTEEH